LWAEDAPAPFVTVKAAVHTTAELKSATVALLRMLVDRGQLLIPSAATELTRQALLLRVDLTPRGTERIGAAVGHDDLVMALMMACGPYRRRRDLRWHSWLADLANPARRLPVLRVPEHLEVPMVSSATGVEVPRVPLLGSVSTADVTVPPELRDRTLRDVETEARRERVWALIKQQQQEAANAE
jgi:hypothetical protein